MRNRPAHAVILLALVLAVGSLCVGIVSTPSISSAGAHAQTSLCAENRGCSTSAQCDGGLCVRHRCFCF